MGPDRAPRHRADVPRRARLAHLRREVAHLLAGRDLYADDALLRPAAAAPTTDEELWAALPPPSRVGRHPQPA